MQVPVVYVVLILAGVVLLNFIIMQWFLSNSKMMNPPPVPQISDGELQRRIHLTASKLIAEEKRRNRSQKKIIQQVSGTEEYGLNQRIDKAVKIALDERMKRGSHSFPGVNRYQAKPYPPVKELNDISQKRILVTGGAGFVGSHLVDFLMKQGHLVIVIDNLFTGKRKNIEQWIGHPNFDFVVHDVINPFFREVDQIYHLACPASPPHYQYNPVKTIKTSTIGTMNMLGLAKRVQARILLASTSEVYGDPEQHPQKETYFGNVNTMGPRSCYDEGKRVAETMMKSYESQSGVSIRIARIFNTFGPRMNLRDGRVVSNFIMEALQDLVEGLVALMNSNTSLPVNIGNPEEYTIRDFAKHINKLTNSSSGFTFLPSTKDDPRKRRPDITRAKELIHWYPQVKVEDGLQKTIQYFADELALHSDIVVEPVAPPE